MGATTTATRERRLPLRDWEVRAVREGRKTQLRRAVRPQPPRDGRWEPKEHSASPGLWIGYTPDRKLRNDAGEFRCPFGVPGDRFWVVERWKHHLFHNDGIDSPGVMYAADNEVLWRPEANQWSDKRWRPASGMPRWASRFVLENAGVRVERLQDISEEDVIAEGLEVQHGTGTGSGPGFKWDGPGYWDGFSTGQFGRTYHAPTREGLCCCNAGQDMKISPARCAFRHYWEATDGKSHPWLSNPWVWCVSLRVVESD